MLSGPELPGWQVSIVNKDGTPFREPTTSSAGVRRVMTTAEHEVVYSASGEALPTVTCYLECEEDKEFGILLQTPANSKRDAEIAYHVDGIRITGWAYSPRGPAEKLTRFEIYQRSDDGTMAKASLKFGKLIRKEEGDDNGPQDKRAAEQLGEIRACIFTGVKGVPFKEARIPDPALQTSVSEKAKKALVGHSVQAGNAQPLTAAELYHTTAKVNRDTPGHPQMTFIFRYRNRNLLEALRVIQSARPAQDISEDAAVPRKKKRKSSDMLASGGQVIEVKDEVKREVKPRIDDDDDGIVFLRESGPGRRSSRKVIDFVDLDSDDE